MSAKRLFVFIVFSLKECKSCEDFGGKRGWLCGGSCTGEQGVGNPGGGGGASRDGNGKSFFVSDAMIGFRNGSR